MPACLAHNQFAHRVLEVLPETEQKAIRETAFDWGAQGPDFLFCHRYFPWMRGKSLKSYGNRIHASKPSLVFDGVRDFLKDHPDPAYRSYAYGLVCHYALDSLCHPYINALASTLLRQRPYETQGTLHGETEAALDAIILRRETGQLPTEVPLKRMFPKEEAVQRRIAKLYHDLIFRLFSEEAEEKELFRATCDAHFVFLCLTDRTTLKKKVFDAIEKGKPHLISSHLVPLTENPEIDYANIGNSPWEARGVSHKESFFELFDQAKELAKAMIEGFDGCDFSILTEDRPFG